MLTLLYISGAHPILPYALGKEENIRAPHRLMIRIVWLCLAAAPSRPDWSRVRLCNNSTPFHTVPKFRTGPDPSLYPVYLLPSLPPPILDSRAAAAYFRHALIAVIVFKSLTRFPPWTARF